MRLTLVLHTLNPATGGVASATLELACALAERGHAVTLLTLDDPAAPFLSSPSPLVKILALGPAPRAALPEPRSLAPLLHPSSVAGPKDNSPSWLLSIISSFGFIPDLEAQLSAIPRPDAFLLNGLWLSSTAPFARFAERNRIPYFLFPHGMLDAYFSRFPLKQLKKLLYYLLVERRTLHRASALLYTTSAELAASQKTFPCFHPRRQLIVGLGLRSSPAPLSIARESFLSAFPALRERPFLLYLSRFHPKKAPHLLLRALRDFPAATLVMAGPLDDGPYLRRLKREAPPDRVLWTGLLEGPLKWGALACADALVLPSHQENFGMVVPEALSAGTPVLLSDKVALAPDVLADGCGLVAPDTLAGTRALLSRFFSLTPAQRSDLRAAARPSYEKRFLPATVATRLEALILECCSAPPAIPPCAPRNPLK